MAPTELNHRDWPIYRCYGFNLGSDATFAAPLSRGDGAAEVTFTLADTEAPATEWHGTEPTYASEGRLESGESALCVYRGSGFDYDVVRFAQLSEYYLWPDRIVCHLRDPEYGFTVELYLLGLVFSLWLECRGSPALHASAVVVDDRVVAFLSGNRGGKSSLAGKLMQRGYPLLTDDILPVEHRDGQMVGRPSYPQMRLWPPEADYFLGSHEHLPLAHPRYTKRRVRVGPGSFGRFCDRLVPLSAIYLPEQREGASVRIEPVAPGPALIALVRQSFAAHLAEAMGLRASRFRFFSELLRKVPVRRLVYPSGFQHLDEVCDAVVEDVATPSRSDT